MNGSGSPNNPYQIETIDHLQAMADDLGAHYVLANDVDASGFEFDPVGNTDIPFFGSLDGNGYAISNLTVDVDGDGGLFGRCGYAEIGNLELESVDVTATGYVGGLVGYVLDGRQNRRTTIHETRVEGSVVSTERYAGGLTAYSGRRTTIENRCTFIGNVSGEFLAGGIIGEMGRRSGLNLCYARATVESDEQIAGGIVGSTPMTLFSFDQIYAACEVEGGRYAGAIAGWIAGYPSSSPSTFANISEEHDVEDERDDGTAGDAADSSDRFGSSVYWDRTLHDDPVGDGNPSAEWESLTTDEMTGDSAEANLDEFDFGSVWTTRDGEYPTFQGEVFEPDTVTASATTLHYINGENENFTQGGHPLHSSQMQLFERGDVISVPIRPSLGRTLDIPVGPVIDNWQKGDMTETLPMELEEALEQEAFKYEDEFGPQIFNKYRFRNQIRIAFETADNGRIDEETIQITFSEQATSNDDSVQFADEPESHTVLVNPDESDVDTPAEAEINNLLGNGWFDSYDELQERGTRKPRYYRYGTTEIDGVEAVRVTTISGGYAGFSHRIANLGTNPTFFSTVWDWGIPEQLVEPVWLALPEEIHMLADTLAVVPNIYAFVDVFALADGRTFVRIWDASPFPSFGLYVDGIQRGNTTVEYDPRDRLNQRMIGFFLQAMHGAGPYHAPSLQWYLRLLRDKEFRESAFIEPVAAFVSSIPGIEYDPREDLAPIPWGTFGVGPDGDSIDVPEDALPSEIPDPFDTRVKPDGENVADTEPALSSDPTENGE